MDIFTTTEWVFLGLWAGLFFIIPITAMQMIDRAHKNWMHPAQKKLEELPEVMKETLKKGFEDEQYALYGDQFFPGYIENIQDFSLKDRMKKDWIKREEIGKKLPIGHFPTVGVDDPDLGFDYMVYENMRPAPASAYFRYFVAYYIFAISLFFIVGKIVD